MSGMRLCGSKPPGLPSWYSIASAASAGSGRPVAEPGVDVFVPEIERLEDVTVGVDDIVGAAHLNSSGAGFRSCGILAQRPLWRKLNVIQDSERAPKKSTT